jgi:hypothetical protein
MTGNWRKLHRNFMICTLQYTVFRDQTLEDEMGEACGMNGGEESCIQILVGEV